ncbi:MAG: DUF935 family protein [Verrucomicrobiota bacterium]
MPEPIPEPLHVRRVNRWREQFNPLRGLTLTGAVALLEAGDRGELANLQWLYRAIERRNPTLRAVKERRLSAVTGLDWEIKTAGTDAAAVRQRDALRAAYDRIGNLREAIAHLALAALRGYAHLEKHYGADGGIDALQPVPQWHLFRDGLDGPWRYNAEARPGRASEADPELPAGDFVIREVDGPVNEVALIAHLRQTLSQKDWDAFVETYGIPPLFLELPPNVPADREDDYQRQAEAVIGNARGTMPNGTKVHTVETALRGEPPFLAHLRYQDECIVLAGTGGKLTLLTESGSGTLAGGAHQRAFDEIAAAEAGHISEVLQAQLDAPLLAALFPGEPVRAYFELVSREITHPGELAEQAERLARAGYRVEPAQLSERLGYTVRAEGASRRFEAVPPSDPRQTEPIRRSSAEEAVVLRNRRESHPSGERHSVAPLQTEPVNAAEQELRPPPEGVTYASVGPTRPMRSSVEPVRSMRGSVDRSAAVSAADSGVPPESSAGAGQDARRGPQQACASAATASPTHQDDAESVGQQNLNPNPEVSR